MARKVLLFGGSRDHETVEVAPYQNVVYVTKRLSYEEYRALDIDDNMAWKPPEEIYERNEHGEYVHVRTVNYKP